MKKFEITPKGSLSQYMKNNIIKAKNEINHTLLAGPGMGDMSCFGIVVPESSKGLSVSL
ncbi:hypothetical protein [Salmonirosea aquatica]|uniref:hypothetical protein n=1 Tax=Salmonirosea aquatica TaxID=2654236 RepID=UPI003570E692